MLKVSNLRVPLDADLPSGRKLVEQALARKLGLSLRPPLQFELLRKSVDSRRKGNVHFVLSLAVDLGEREIAMLPKNMRDVSLYSPPARHIPPRCSGFVFRPVVVGAGPAGLFAALELARAGARPIVFERGYDVSRRRKAVEGFFKDGRLDQRCNVQFGEGGAGAFSDGKLNTGTHSPLGREVLQTFVDCGAPKEILTDAKPHIGTDLLGPVLVNMRNLIESLGATFCFSTRLVGLEADNGRLKAALVESADGLESSQRCDFLVLACGHSALDTYRMLARAGIVMRPKPFSVGVRIEHLQSSIDRMRYGDCCTHEALGPADYKLSVHTTSGRGVYTFCMCPGGQVIAAASENGGVVTNGMSDHARCGTNANSALLTSVQVEDFCPSPDCDPLSGFKFQRDIEQAAYSACGGGFAAPAQLLGDFIAGRATAPEDAASNPVQPTYPLGVKWTDLKGCLPGFVTDAILEALPLLERKLPGFVNPQAVLTGVETRSSSPVAIPRDDGLESSLKGLYPCGEGAGHAGGIVSAAADGIRAADAAVENAS